MEDVLRMAEGSGESITDQNRRISTVIQQESRRLLNFIRNYVEDEADAEDILQDVFYELTESFRLMKPVDRVGAWLFRVARNRIIDRFRRKQKPSNVSLSAETEEGLTLGDLLPSLEGGPETEYVRSVLLEEMDAALDELPEEQRAVFVANEIDGRSFKDLSKETGVSLNTLLSRKRYAVLHLRRRLEMIYEEIRSK